MDDVQLCWDDIGPDGTIIDSIGNELMIASTQHKPLPNISFNDRIIDIVDGQLEDAVGLQDDDAGSNTDEYTHQGDNILKEGTITVPYHGNMPVNYYTDGYALGPMVEDSSPCRSIGCTELRLLHGNNDYELHPL